MLAVLAVFSVLVAAILQNRFSPRAAQWAVARKD